MIQRKPACKVWISDIGNGQLKHETGEFGMYYFVLKDQPISRVNLVGNVVDVFISPERSFASVALDDGSGTINVRTFKEDIGMLEGLKVGDMVMVIGRIREYNNDKYVIPEIIKNLTDPNWELVRKLELLKEYGKPKKIEGSSFVEVKSGNLVMAENGSENIVSEQVGEVTSSSRNKILSLIEKADENGAEHSFILTSLGITEEEAAPILKELLSEGEIYQNRPGRYKVI